MCLSEGVNETEVNEIECLPEGLVVEQKSEGGGDSLFESVLYGLRELKGRFMMRENQNGVNELREL